MRFTQVIIAFRHWAEYHLVGEDKISVVVQVRGPASQAATLHALMGEYGKLFKEPVDFRQPCKVMGVTVEFQFRGD